MQVFWPVCLLIPASYHNIQLLNTGINTGSVCPLQLVGGCAHGPNEGRKVWKNIPSDKKSSDIEGYWETVCAWMQVPEVGLICGHSKRRQAQVSRFQTMVRRLILLGKRLNRGPSSESTCDRCLG